MDKKSKSKVGVIPSDPWRIANVMVYDAEGKLVCKVFNPVAARLIVNAPALMRGWLMFKESSQFIAKKEFSEVDQVLFDEFKAVVGAFDSVIERASGEVDEVYPVALHYLKGDEYFKLLAWMLGLYERLMNDIKECSPINFPAYDEELGELLESFLKANRI